MNECSLISFGHVNQESIIDRIKRLDFDNAVNQTAVRGASEESLQHVRRCWYPTDEERKEDELKSKMAEIALRNVRYSAFDL